MCRGLPLDGAGVPALGPVVKSRSTQRPQLYDDDFLVYSYKVVPCDKTWRHDFSSCPFSHPGESSERRHPSTYLPFMCGSTQHSTDLKEKCPFGTSCKYAHGHFELWLHPGRFRTKMCSLGENCKRQVCFFAHSEQELRVTSYSKLETAAEAAAQQLAQMGQQLDGSNCSSLTSASIAASSIRSSSDGSELKSGTCAVLSSPCGSDAGHSLLEQQLHSNCSPCGSVVCEDGGNFALTAGMVLNTQAAMLEMQLQNNSLLAAAASDAAAASAPSMWLAGSSMLPQQVPLAYGGLLPQQQLVYLDAANTGSQVMTYAPAAVPAAGSELVGGSWVLPAVNTAAPAAARLADQWAASNMLAQQQQVPAPYGMATGLAACNPMQMQRLPVPSMGNGMDQWLQLDNSQLCAPPGLNRSVMGCGISQQQPTTTANARVAQLLSTLPDQTVQQLLGMLTVEAQGA